MPTLFDFIYAAAIPVVAPGLLYKRFALGKYRESLPAMLGLRLPKKSSAGKSPQTGDLKIEPPVNAWLHAVSVGEVVAAAAVMKAIAQRKPHWRFLASTTTETGQNKARQTLKQAADIFFYPLDLSWIVRRFFDVWNPDMVIIHETELWPNFLLEARKRRIPVYLANGKVSPRSAKRYRMARAIFAKPLSAFELFCMQTEADAERIKSMGAPARAVHVTGNCKFDSPGEPLSASERREWLARYGWSERDRVVVAGSTHPGEEDIVLAAFARAKAKFPDLRMILAPRHPERFQSVADKLERELPQMAQAAGASNPWRFDRVSKLSPGASADSPDVMMLDTIGQLARAYGLGQVALCGGSWANIGGHNLLEAAVHSIPVMRGPHMQNQPEITRILGPENGGMMVESENLGDELAGLFADDAKRTELGQKAARAVARNKGAGVRTAELILNAYCARR